MGKGNQMKNNHLLFAIIAVSLGMVVTSIARQPTPATRDPHQQQGTQSEKADKPDQSHDHHAGVNKRGDEVMGFDHTKTTHHFHLRPDGGLIQVEANDPGDSASRDQIRTHLKHIAKKFADGDFAAPMQIHAQTPPGVPVMGRLRAEIKYQVEELERGGLVRITTSNSKALAAVHEFLRFQIKDHKTGDSGEVVKP
jgi:hypothetical protein